MTSEIMDVIKSKSGPEIQSKGPSSLTAADRLSRALGWFSIGLGLTEFLVPHRITKAIGMKGKEGLIRTYGVREIASGIMSLSVDKKAGLWSRVGGDGIDIMTLVHAYRCGNYRKRNNVCWALAMVGGVTLLDIIGAKAVTMVHARKKDDWRDYSDRSGFPKPPPKVTAKPKPSAPVQNQNPNMGKPH